MALDGTVTQKDGLLAMCAYVYLVISLELKKGLLDKMMSITHRSRVSAGKELVKIFIGVIVIFIASRFVVDQTEYFSHLFNVSPFLVSLLFIGIGTNLPELSLVVRSTLMRNHQVAFGDYVGSAAFNTFLLGFLTTINGKPIVLTNNYLFSLLFLVLGLVLFYYFCRTKNMISRQEGILLLAFYGLFLVTELI